MYPKVRDRARDTFVVPTRAHREFYTPIIPITVIREGGREVSATTRRCDGKQRYNVESDGTVS